MPHPDPRPLALVLTLVAACAGPEESQGLLTEDLELVASDGGSGEDVSIGKFLADMDASIRAWSNLTMTAQGAKDRAKRRKLELALIQAAHERTDELVEQVQTGPPLNRIRAAAALGFTRSESALSPLVGALHDPEPDVVHNALLGLAILQDRRTPVSEVCDVLASSPDPMVRSNGVFCLLSVAQVGGRSDCLARAGRTALTDPEPLVRAQGALLLAELNDVEAIDEVGRLVFDGVPFVEASAIQALGRFGAEDPGQTGRVARLLVAAVDRVPTQTRERILGVLEALRGRDLGADTRPWSEWAHGLP